MATIDDRVVAMSFENSKFESGVSKSLGTLDKLKSSLKFSGATAGLDTIEKRASRMDLSGISNSLNSIQNKFSGLGLAATAAFATIVQQATQAGLRIAKAVTLDPVLAGFHNYEMQIQAVQTIMANTGLTGKKGMGQINSALQQLNTYANLTIYNFSEMAKNIGTFTAAGVDLKTATSAIKGIANLAAASGSTSQQASTAMYQLSQAIAAGRVSLQDWNSVVNAGIGGTMFQKALANTGEAMGTLGKNSVKLVGPMKQLTINGQTFRNAIQAKPGRKSWLTSDVLTTALKEFTGDMSKAQLAAIGFSDSQIKSIQAQAKTAVNAATQIKTATQLFQALKEEVATAWAAVFKTIFGSIGGATKLFSSLHTTIQNALTNPIIHFNKVLGQWVKLGGKTDLFAGIKAGARDLEAVLKPIKEAFRDIFPASTGRSLTEASKSFRSLMESLKIGPKTAENLHRTFRGVFALFDIGKQIISGIVHFFGMLFGDIKKGSGGLTAFTGNVGDVLFAFDQWLKKSHSITDFFEKLAHLIQPVVHWLSQFAGNMGNATSAVGSSSVFATATAAWKGFVSALQKVGQFLKPAVDAIVGVFSKTADLIKKALKGQNYDAIFGIIQTTLVGGLLLTLKNALGGGLKIDFGGGALKGITGALGTLQGTLKSLQTNIKAQTIYTIAKAIALLAGAILLLSLIPAKRMTSSMSAVTLALGELMAALSIISKSGGFIKAPVIAAGLIAMAIAVDIISLAIAGLSLLSWDQLKKGLVGVGGALVALSAAAIPLKAAGPRMAVAALGLIPLAIGLTMIAGAVSLMGHMNVGTLMKGILGSAAALMALGQAARFIPLRLPILAGGIVILATGLTILAGAVSAMGHMNMDTLVKGIVGSAAAIMAIGMAMRFMPLTLPVTAAGLVLVGVAMTILAGAVSAMGHMSVATLAKGIIAMGGALVVLGFGLKGMITALPGAAALLAVGVALTMLVPMLGLLGQMKITTILKGLAALTGILLVFGVVGRLVAPGLVALGVGLGALGVAMLAIGGAVYLLAAGVALLAGTGSKGVAAFMVALTAMVAMLPTIIINFLKGLAQVIAAIAQLAPKVVGALVVIIGQLLDGLIKLSPKFAEAATALITALLQVLADNAGPIIRAGMLLLMQLLSGISNNIGRLVGLVAQIVARFFNALASHIGEIVAAGANFLVHFLAGIASNLGKIMDAGGQVIAQFLIGLGKNLGKIADAAGEAIAQFVAGVGRAIWRIIRAAVNLVGTFLDAIAHEIPKLSWKAFNALHVLLWNMAWVIRKEAPVIIQDFVNLGKAIVGGIAEGIKKAIVDPLLSPFKSMGDLLTGLVENSKKQVKAHSPSKVFMELGMNIVHGLSKGIEDNTGHAINTVGKSTAAIGNAITTALDQVQNNKDIEWRITPVVDMTNVKDAHKSISNSFPKVRANVDVPTVTAKEDALLAHSPTGGRTVKFEQNNYSPTALSEREIYRQTRNQLSQAKAALKM